MWLLQYNQSEGKKPPQEEKVQKRSCKLHRRSHNWKTIYRKRVKENRTARIFL